MTFGPGKFEGVKGNVYTLDDSYFWLGSGMGEASGDEQRTIYPCGEAPGAIPNPRSGGRT